MVNFKDFYETEEGWEDKDGELIDWYETEDHPLVRLFDEALEELSMWSEPSVQGGRGANYFYPNDEDETYHLVDDFQEEVKFMNNEFELYMKGRPEKEIVNDIKIWILTNAERCENDLYYFGYDDDDEYEDEEF